MDSLRILLIEDEHILALTIRKILEKNGHTVAAMFASGEDALDAFEKTDTDLIVTDINLKGQLDGIETAGKLRESSDIPVVFLTAYADAATLERVRTVNPNGYILKPVVESVFLVTIETAMARYRMEKKDRIVSELITDFSYSFTLCGDDEYLLEWVRGPKERPPVFEEGSVFTLEKFLSLILPEDRKGFAAHFRGVLEGKRSTHEYRTFSRGGGIRWFRDSSSPETEGDRVVRVYGGLQDITEIRRYQLCIEQQRELAIELSEAESLEEAVRVALEYGILISEADWGRVYLEDRNGAMAQVLQEGTLRSEIDLPPPVVGRNYFDGTGSSDSHQGITDPRVRVLPFFHRDNPLGLVLLCGERLAGMSPAQYSALETLARQLGVCVQRLRTARALSESETRHRIISNLISDFAYSVELAEDGAEEIHWMSGAYERITGYTLEEFQSIPGGWQSIIDPRDSASGPDFDPAVYRKEPVQLEYRIRSKSGGVKWIQDFIHPIYDFHLKRVVRILGACRDITARKSVELELLRQKERAENYFRIAGVMLIILDTKGRVVQINEKGLGVLGFSRGELVGRDWFELCIPEMIRAEVRRGFEAFLTEKSGRSRVYYGRQGANPVLTAEGETRTFFWTNELIRDAEGEVIGTVSSGEDISEKIEAQNERERHKEQLIKADRLASLGVLVAGVGHEVNNPNQAILAAVQLLQEIWRDGRVLLDERFREKGNFSLGGESYRELLEVIPQYLKDIENGARRVEHFIRDLRRYSRNEENRIFQEVGINDVISSVLVLLRSTVDSSVTQLNLELEDDLPPVKGHFQRLEQVMVNLIQNACHALRQKPGVLTIRSYGGFGTTGVVVEVEDKGPGIEPDVVARITEPFYTTKQDSGGMGLGLSISSTIVRDHGGRLDFISAPGEGTVARISLPRIG